MKIIALTLILISSLSASAADIIGTDVVAGGSPSTCVIFDQTSKEYFCNGALVGKNEVQTASHCARYIPLKNLEVFCDAQSDGSFGYRSTLTGKIQMKDSLILRGKNDPAPAAESLITQNQMNPWISTEVDQAIIETVTSASEKIIARRYTEAEFKALNPVGGNQDIGQIPPYSLICVSESFGPDLQNKMGTLQSGKIPTLNMRFFESGKISSIYDQKLTNPEDIRFIQERLNPRGNIDNDVRKLGEIQARFKTPVLSRPGDSGSPLYCYDQRLGPETKKLMGILAHANNEFFPSSDPPGSYWLQLGSRWGFALDPKTYFTRFNLE